MERRLGALFWGWGSLHIGGTQSAADAFTCFKMLTRPTAQTDCFSQSQVSPTAAHCWFKGNDSASVGPPQSYACGKQMCLSWPCEVGGGTGEQPVFTWNSPSFPQISHIIREIRQFQQTAYKIEHQAKVRVAFSRSLPLLWELDLPPQGGSSRRICLKTCCAASLSERQYAH